MNKRETARVMKRNARLIATAPVMYEAGKELISLIDLALDYALLTPEQADTIEKARALLARIKGR